MSSYVMFYGMLSHIQKLENRINEAKLFLAHCSFMEEAPEMHAILDGEITAAETIAGQVAEETRYMAKQIADRVDGDWAEYEDRLFFEDGEWRLKEKENDSNRV